MQEHTTQDPSLLELNTQANLFTFEQDELPSENEEDELDVELEEIECQIPFEEPPDNILEFLYVINNKIDNLREEFMETIKSIDIKKIKKNRTPHNRCNYINRKGERCKGYFCKESKSLCYAHHNIVKRTLKKTHFLYGSKNRKDPPALLPEYEGREEE